MSHQINTLVDEFKKEESEGAYKTENCSYCNLGAKDGEILHWFEMGKATCPIAKEEEEEMDANNRYQETVTV